MRAVTAPRLDLHLGDGVAWMEGLGARTVAAVVTDPPFGKEYSAADVSKMRAGAGGVWRKPTSFDGAKRKPAPRFTVLTATELADLASFFAAFGRACRACLVPGGHVLMAATPLLAPSVVCAVASSGLEYRGSILRLVRSRRGGDRPKGAEAEFPGVSVMPRGGWEPWAVFREPLSETTVAANLRRWGTGGLRRPEGGGPLDDVLRCGVTPKAEAALSPHPHLKPQALMRQLVRAALPLGRGLVVDPFAGGGSTLGAARALGLDCAGAEIDPAWHEALPAAVQALASLRVECQRRPAVSR